MLAGVELARGGEARERFFFQRQKSAAAPAPAAITGQGAM